jgi:hypothetical protein
MALANLVPSWCQTWPVHCVPSRLDDCTTFLWWKGTIDGHEIESFDVLVDNAEGLLQERTVAYRPFPAVAIFLA